MDFKQIIKSIEDKKFNSIYLLHGVESYYIDAITDAITKHALAEEERDFNQTVVYGKDVDLLALVSQLKQYPMMSERQLVILKEAQDVKNWEALESYLNNPLSSTVFVIAYKYKKVDSRLKFVKAIQKNGLIFESKKIYENQAEAWINDYLRSKNYKINAKAALLLVDHLGVDLGKIVKELDKLMIVLKSGTEINPVHIQENIGISKDYNVFELNNAIAKRDVSKAFKIIKYFEQNPKATHITVVIPTIFSFFDRLMRAHFMKASNPNQIASALRIHIFAAKEMFQAMQIYKPKKVAKNITLLHEYDLKSKGISGGTNDGNQLMKELLYQLMH